MREKSETKGNTLSLINETELHSFTQSELTDRVESLFDNSHIIWNELTKREAELAIEKATQWHQGQTRFTKPGDPLEPYINHPLRNTIRAFSWGVFDAEVLVATLLHDVVEDCAVEMVGRDVRDEEMLREKALNILSDMFSPRGSHLVSAVTNPLSLMEAQSAEERRQEYVKHVASVLGDVDVFFVKFADFVDNAGSLADSFDTDKPGKFRNLYRKYSGALGVFEDSFARLHSSFTTQQIEGVEDSLNTVRESLSSVESLLGQG